VRFRDFRFIIPMMVQLGMWVSVFPFSSTQMRAKLGDLWYSIYTLNPLVGIIDGFRWAILGEGASLPLLNLFISLFVSLLIFAAGVTFFRKTERHFADII
jgi:lipopolysaccharide transport system permease protein